MNKPKKPQEPNRLSDKEKKLLLASGIFLSVFAVAILIFTIGFLIELEDPMVLLYAPGSLFMGGMAYYSFYQIPLVLQVKRMLCNQTHGQPVAYYV